MTPETIQSWLDINPVLMPWALGAAALILSALVFLVGRTFIGRGLEYVSARTATRYDDIVVEKLRPYRFAWIAPLLLIYYFADLVPAGAGLIRQIALFLVLWLVVITLNALLNAVNAIYESSDLYKGESIKGYLDLIKVVLIVAAIIVTISLFTGQSPVALLGGLGVVMGLVVLVFRDTILGFVASVQINSSDLLMEGDAIEMPSFGADGSVLDISLHTVKVQNWDKAITVIPTYKFLDTPYKNWRGMLESGGRRIKRAIHIDVNSIRFSDLSMMEYFGGIDLIRDYVEAELAKGKRADRTSDWSPENPFDEPLPTNIEVFQEYVTSYMKNRPDIHQENMTLMVRQLAPGPTGLPLEIYAFTTGLPLEIYAFTKTVDWADYEAIQAQIIDHLLAAMPQFGLKVFQQPTGADLRTLAGA